MMEQLIPYSCRDRSMSDNEPDLENGGTFVRREGCVCFGAAVLSGSAGCGRG